MSHFTMRLLGTAAACCLAFALAGCMDAGQAGQSGTQAAQSTASAEGAAPESGSSAKEDADDESGEDAEELAAPEDVTESCDLFRLRIPGDIAQYLDLRKTQDNCLSAYYGDVCLFEVAAYDTFEHHGSEWKHRVYSCGYGADADGWHDVTATFPYITTDGANNAHWGDKDADVLALAYLVGITDEDVLPWIQVQVASGERLGTPRWDDIYPVLVSDDLGETSDRPLPSGSSSSAKPKADDADAGSSSSSAAVSSSTSESGKDDEAGDDGDKDDGNASNATESPFWGVWAAAFKDAGNAESLAAQARAAGWPDAGVYTTTSWSDLNSERWYAVSLQRCGSQDEAATAAKKAQKQGYDGAYAKYTGDFKG